MGKDQMPKNKSDQPMMEDEEQIVGLSASEEMPESEEVAEQGQANDEVVLEASEQIEQDMPSEELSEEVIDQIPFQMADKDFVEEDGQIEEVAETFIDSDELISIIESLLFATDKALSVNQMYQAFAGTNIKKKQIKKALSEYQSILADRTRGVTLEEVSGGYQLRSKVDNANFLKKMNKVRPFRLSGPALEVMSIVAYKQPIVKSEVDQIRGVESGHLVRALMEKGLVCFAGKSELPGKPMQYATTRKFLDIFGLRNLKELPTLAEIEELLPDGIGDEEDNEVLADITDHMSEEEALSYSEGQEELEKIVDQINSIDTSSDFFEEEKRKQRQKRDRDRAANIREALDLNETVEDKDVKWLQRYEAKLEEERLALEAKAAEEAKLKESLDGGVQLEAGPEEGETTGDLSELPQDVALGLDELAAQNPAEDLSDKLSEEGLSVVSIEEAFFEEEESVDSEEMSMSATDSEEGQVETFDMSSEEHQEAEEASEDEIDQFLGLGSDDSESSLELESTDQEDGEPS